MYTICEIKGKQYQVEQGKEYRVDFLNAKDNDEIVIDTVLLFKDDKGKTLVGNPYVQNVVVHAKIVNPVVRGEKVIAFKYKRRKGFRKTIGHKQRYSVIAIEKITQK